MLFRSVRHRERLRLRERTDLAYDIARLLIGFSSGLSEPFPEPEPEPEPESVRAVAGRGGGEGEVSI